MVPTDQISPIMVVCDAGPLIHLDEVGCLDLLADFSEVQVPEAVWAEVLRHRPSVVANSAVKLSRVSSKIPPPAELEALALVLSLHNGEWEALRVALENPCSLLLTDDTAARMAAGNLGITCHGTIGILIRSIRRQQRTKQEILVVLRGLPKRSTLHLKRSLLDAVIGELEKQI